jgi:hypothetical protein
VYLRQDEVADATKRYGGIVDDEDHDARIYEVKPSTELSQEALVVLAYYLNQGFGDEVFNSLRDRAVRADEEELKDLRRRRTYRPAGMDLTESSDKEMRLMSGASERYEKGAEVYMSYGRNSNRQLLSVYGFSLKANHFNFLVFKTEFKNLLENERLAAKISIPDFQPDLCVRFKLKEKVLCMGLVRTLRKLWWNKNFPINAFFSPSLMELEVKVLEKGLRLLQDLQNSFPSTLEEDLGLLSADLPIRKYFAVLYRSQLKQILKNQITYFSYLREICSLLFEGSSFSEAKANVLSAAENADQVEKALNAYFVEIETN